MLSYRQVYTSWFILEILFRYSRIRQSPVNQGVMFELILEKLVLLQIIELLKDWIFQKSPVMHLVHLLYSCLFQNLSINVAQPWHRSLYYNFTNTRNKQLSPKSPEEIRQFLFVLFLISNRTIKIFFKLLIHLHIF